MCIPKEDIYGSVATLLAAAIVAGWFLQGRSGDALINVRFQIMIFN